MRTLAAAASTAPSISTSPTTAPPLDQPGAERIESGDLRDVDEDVGPAAGKFFGIGHDLLQHRRIARGPRAGSAQLKPATACNPLQCRVAVHDAISCADFPPWLPPWESSGTPRPSPCRIHP